jgi:hypothetical protein
MTWHESRLGKVWKSISNRGLRAGIEDALARWARNRSTVSEDVWRDFSWILGENRQATLQAPKSAPLRINWFVPSVAQGSGGSFNIFRTIQEFEKWGHKQRIYTVGERTIGGEVAKESVQKHYFPIQTGVELFSGKVSDSDALVATSWTTAYAARTVGNTARKFYFVQDLEHLFYPEGSLCEFTKQTYQWGFYGITAGKWIADVLHNQFGMECSAFGFSYDRATYSRNGNRRCPAGNKRVLF